MLIFALKKDMIRGDLQEELQSVIQWFHAKAWAVAPIILSVNNEARIQLPIFENSQDIAALRNGQIITCKFDMLSFHPDDPSF